MQTGVEAVPHDGNRVAKLHLTANTFEEERILSAIAQAMILGGDIAIKLPNREKPISCTFVEAQKL